MVLMFWNPQTLYVVLTPARAFSHWPTSVLKCSRHTFLHFRTLHAGIASSSPTLSDLQRRKPLVMVARQFYHKNPNSIKLQSFQVQKETLNYD